MFGPPASARTAESKSCVSGSLELRDHHAREMVALRPEVILAVTPRVVLALLRETRTIPMVFVDGPESAIGGFVAADLTPAAMSQGSSTSWIPCLANGCNCSVSGVLLRGSLTEKIAGKNRRTLSHEEICL